MVPSQRLSRTSSISSNEDPAGKKLHRPVAGAVEPGASGA
ncbi:BSLF2 protein [human gammaherpesvirus 4]|uniref:BSLF2 n=1 Tax=Epstein-Barr virus (strain GD1) TaxID=10376 RepID=A0A0A8IK25_EBVG|nr:BSLF2 protein [human gammaherpesvirus 4]AKA28386.1 BSLF2 protein [human gammaherpesvirus 4]AKA28456.1 BSLF2 protein [human gammaherpesvirus 4]AKA28597.1 BSLF2 protein [human gammaherpesvirus 4]AKA28671.1 BSLF2 protein [human gammaherpesvirus 4]